jgi:hypothetical protein
MRTALMLLALAFALFAVRAMIFSSLNLVAN